MGVSISQMKNGFYEHQVMMKQCIRLTYRGTHPRCVIRQFFWHKPIPINQNSPCNINGGAS